MWSIPYVSVAFFPSLKNNFIAYRSSKVSSRPDCIFEIHQLWQSGFSRLYSNCCCSCWFEPEIMKIGQSSLKMYSNNIVNFQKSTTILNACTKKSGNLLKAPRTLLMVYNALIERIGTLINRQNTIIYRNCTLIELSFQWIETTAVSRLIGWLVCWVLWHINLCRLFNAKSIFM